MTDIAADLGTMTPAEMDELAAVLRARAAAAREPLPVDRAREIVAGVELSDEWRRSQFSEFGRLRTAACRLTADGWTAPQIVGALCVVGHEIYPVHDHWATILVARAVTEGVRDGRRLRQ